MTHKTDGKTFATEQQIREKIAESGKTRITEISKHLKLHMKV